MKSFQEFITEGKGERIEFAGYPDQYDSLDKPDSYYYHVTPKANVKKIIRNGILKTPYSTMADGFYANYSRGKIFFSERNGVSYWATVIQRHLEYNNEEGESKKLAVIRFPKSFVSDVRKDEIGTKDSCRPAYYTTEDISNPEVLSRRVEMKNG